MTPEKYLRRLRQKAKRRRDRARGRVAPVKKS